MLSPIFYYRRASLAPAHQLDTPAIGYRLEVPLVEIALLCIVLADRSKSVELRPLTRDSLLKPKAAVLAEAIA